jgi:hypothetical protein
LFTLFAITVNPSLVDIFENTLGLSFISLWGSSQFANEIFKSKMFDEILNNSDTNQINYNFLLTRLNNENVEDFIKFSCGKTENENENNEIMFDFKLNLKTEEQAERLIKYVNLKNTFGHFMWIYLSSVISLIISMIAMVL